MQNFILTLVQEKNVFVCVTDSLDSCGQNVKTIVHGLFPPQTANCSHLDKLWALKREICQFARLVPSHFPVVFRVKLGQIIIFIFFFWSFEQKMRPCCFCGSPLSSQCSGNNTPSPKDFNFKSWWIFMQWQGRCLYLRCLTPFPQ